MVSKEDRALLQEAWTMSAQCGNVINVWCIGAGIPKTIRARLQVG